MASNFVELKEICKKITKGTTPTTLGGKFSEEGINFIKSESLNYDGSIDTTKFAKIDIATHTLLKRSQIEANDILYSIAGINLGKCGSAKAEYLPANTNQAVAIIRVDPQKAVPKYVEYYLRDLSFVNAVNSSVAQSAQPNVNLTDIGNFKINLPSIEQQKDIVSILSILDERIDLNQHTNKTLEAIAQVLFKSWFIDFDPVKAKAEGQKPGGLSDDLAVLFPDRFASSLLGQIPQGWEIKPLGEYVTVKRGGSPRPIQDYLSSEGLPWVKISDATASLSPYIMETNQYIKESGLKKTVLLRKGDLILSNSATPGLPKFLNLDACIHDGWLYFPQKKMFGDYYLYQLFLTIKDILISKGNGSVFTNLKTDILKSQLVVVPPYNLLAQYEIIAKAIFEKILANEEEIKTLSQLRDILLPRLISGKLRVDEISEIMEALAS